MNNDTTWLNGYSRGFTDGAIAALESLQELGRLPEDFVEDFKSRDMHAEVIAAMRDRGWPVDA